jgi:hypothetical protein
MILNIKIELIWGRFAKEDWTAIMEVDSSSTLEDLHHIIQQTVRFDNDHMYEFYIARTPTSRDKRRFDDEDGAVFSVTLEDLFPLPKARSLYYMFDYGDSWLFKVSKGRKKPHAPIEGREYPALIDEIGERPVQYVFEDDNL